MGIVQAIGRALSLTQGKTMQGPEENFDSPAAKKIAAAIAAGEAGRVKTLLTTTDVQPDLIGKNGLTFLSIAILANRKEAFETLIELGAVGDPEGKAAGHTMYNATMVSNISWLQGLLKAGASLDGFGGGNRLIVQAMNSRIKGRLDYYLDNGANIDGESNLGGTAALTAARNQQFETVNDLLDRGASIWAMDKLGGTIGYHAAAAGKLPTWKVGGPHDKQRVRILDRLKKAGFPSPAPAPKVGIELKKNLQWPPKK